MIADTPDVTPVLPPTDPPENAAALVAVLGRVYAFYGKDFTDAHAMVWLEAMRPYDAGAVRAALNRHAIDPDRGQFLPRPADIVRLIDGGGTDAALVAWSKVDKAVRTVGPYQSVVFDDPLIHAAIDGMGGWTRFATSDEREWPHVAREFQARYRGSRTTGAASYPRTLAGIAQHRNEVAGQPVAAPVAIGDVERARLVYRRGGHAGAVTAIPLADLAPAVLALTE